MPEYLNTSWVAPTHDDRLFVPRSDALNLPGHWLTFTVPLVEDIADSANHHDSPVNFGYGPRYCNGVLDYQLIGGNPGEEVQIRTYEVDSSGNKVETHHPHEFYLGTRPIPVDPDTGLPAYEKSTHQRFPIFDYINYGHKLRIEITRWDLDGEEMYINYIQFMANYWSK